MLQLFNLSTYEEDLQLFSRDSGKLSTFLANHSLDGLELLIDQPWEAAVIPQRFVKGVHLRYWSNWLDFWQGRKRDLLDQFETRAAVSSYFGGFDRQALVEKYRLELGKAIAAGAEYAVWHVSNARLQELFTYRFAYTDEQVIDATIELVNAVMEGISSNISLLFENLWWPGLTLTNARLVAKLLERIDYPHKGIMLDTGHLMNTNHALRTQQQGIQFILATLRQLGELKDAICGIHLHSSLSGSYAIESIAKEGRNFDKHHIMSHVLKLDQHQPFEQPDAYQIVEYVKPRYLVHEFLAGGLPELSQAITKQQRVLQSRVNGGKLLWIS